jgi:Trypsin-like peptidase domain
LHYFEKVALFVLAMRLSHWAYPLSGVLATDANLTVGNVSALAGLADDSRYVQISAPVQPGNSGGPLLDASGHLVGIVTAKLNAGRVAQFTGDIPQNVNFALKSEVARTFLDSKHIAYQTAHSDQQLSPADVGDIARPFTVYIECEQHGSRSAAAPPPAAPAAPPPVPTAPSWVSSVSPDTPPAPRMSPGPNNDDLRSRATSFVLELFRNRSEPNDAELPRLRGLYGDQVSYYGKIISWQAVVDDKLKFAARWPDRKYQVRSGSLVADCDQVSSTCKVEGIVDWQAQSPARQASSSGSASFSYSLASVGQSFIVVSENSSILQRAAAPTGNYH